MESSYPQETKIKACYHGIRSNKMYSVHHSEKCRDKQQQRTQCTSCHVIKVLPGPEGTLLGAV